jgi:uncharacterized iron-regulated membrane protein
MSSSPFRFSSSLARAQAIRIHRGLGVAACAFWLLQATTGILSVFHWELEDSLISSLRKPTDLQAIQLRLAALAPPHSGKSISMIWTTAGLPDRYDVWVEDERGGPTAVIRIAGDGQVLRRKTQGSHDFFSYVIELHQSLSAGKHGRWVVGLSGILLISNLLLGLRGALPKPGRWKAALWPRRGPSRHTRPYGWHRALGLWFAIPALVLFSAGVGLAYKDGIGWIIGAHAPSMPAELRTTNKAVDFASAVEAAFKAAHSQRLTEVEMPRAEDATYRIRVLGPGELRRAVGTTTVFVSASTGAVRGIFPPSSQPLSQRFINTLYSIHTGEAGGWPGRLLVLAIGSWLATMIILGLRMRSARRKNLCAKSSAKAASPSPPFLQSDGPPG